MLRTYLCPCIFADGVAQEVSSSFANDLEAHLALALVKHLLQSYPDKINPSGIGVITPYNGQVRHIRSLFKEHFTSEVAASKIEVNSVDGFQGREKDIIILSCVRSDRGNQAHRGIGFLRDPRRMNVSITRARCSVFILGHAATLQRDSLWEAALLDATERGCLIKAHSPISFWFENAVKEIAQEPGRKHNACDDASAKSDALARRPQAAAALQHGQSGAKDSIASSRSGRVKRP